MTRAERSFKRALKRPETSIPHHGRGVCRSKSMATRDSFDTVLRTKVRDGLGLRPNEPSHQQGQGGPSRSLSVYTYYKFSFRVPSSISLFVINCSLTSFSNAKSSVGSQQHAHCSQTSTLESHTATS